MSMLSHNAVREENRNLMLDEKMHAQVKDLIENQLGEKRGYGSASLTRNTCLFLKNLASEMEIDDDTIKAASEAMGEWCPGADAGRVSDKNQLIFYDHEDASNIGELQGSRQSMIEISQFFQCLIEDGKYSAEKIKSIMSDTLTADQMNRIGTFTSSRDEECLQNLFGSFVATN